MKKIIFITLVAAFALSACSKEESMGVSTITTFPSIELNGDEAITILVGGTYTELGVTAMEGETVIPASGVITDGSVDNSVPGVYTISYTASNKDGFKVSARRYVGVITPAAAALNISGKYKRNAGALGVATIVKTTYPGLYINDNPGGIAMTGTNQIYIYMFQTEPTVVSCPSQSTVAGEFACTGGIYDATGAAPLYKWVTINGGYGTAVRTFIKQ